MNRTLKELEADLKTFAQSLVAGITDKPTVLLSKLGDKPIKYRIGIAVTGHPDETIKAPSRYKPRPASESPAMGTA